MKSMLQFIAAIACVAALTACGGGTNKTPAVVVVAQPDFKLTDVTVGTGALAEAGDLVTVNYVAYLYDSTKSDFKGAKVDSSVDTGQPAPPFTIGVGARQAGWDQSILGMRVGGKRVAVLPAALAFGSQSFDAKPAVNGNTYAAVPANSPLVYDFELINVTKATFPVVVAPPPALKIVEVLAGTGATAVTGKTASVRYTGWVYDGTRANFKGAQFDSNVAGSLYTFNLDGTATSATVGAPIAGFPKGVLGMLVGGKRTIFIPPDQGYGATPIAGSTANIPANSTLVFDVELISVQ
jgi:peptidylprolyl isomerase